MLLTLKAKTTTATSKLTDLKSKIQKRRPSWQDVWTVGQAHEKVSFSEMDGPWLFIYPKGADIFDIQNFAKWVHKTKDKDFEVILKEC